MPLIESSSIKSLETEDREWMDDGMDEWMDGNGLNLSDTQAHCEPRLKPQARLSGSTYATLPAQWTGHKWVYLTQVTSHQVSLMMHEEKEESFITSILFYSSLLKVHTAHSLTHTDQVWVKLQLQNSLFISFLFTRGIKRKKDQQSRSLTQPV